MENNCNNEIILFETLSNTINPQSISCKDIYTFYKRDVKYLQNIGNIINSIIEELFIENNIIEYVICGSVIKSIFSNSCNIKNDLIIYILNYQKDIFDDNTIIPDNSDSIYINNFNIKIIKNNYLNISDIIKTINNNLDQICYYNKSIYISTLFIQDICKLFNKHKEHINTLDPILNLPYDILNIYEIKNKNTKKIVDMLDIKTLSSISLNEIHSIIECNNSSLTLIEYCLYLLVKTNKKLTSIINGRIQLIMFLQKYTFSRPPLYFAYYLNIDVLYPTVLHMLNNTVYKYNIKNKLELELEINNNCINDLSFGINKINKSILHKIIVSDNKNNFNIFIKTYYNKIFMDGTNLCAKDISDKIIEHNSINIMEILIKSGNVCIYFKLYMILLSQNIDLFKFIYKINNVTDIIFNYIEDIIQNNLLRSLYFLIKNNKNNILNYETEDNKNILFILKNNNLNILDLLLKIKPELLENNDDILHFYAKNNYYNLINFLLVNYSIKYNYIDKDGNTFLHLLCEYGYIDTIKNNIKLVLDIINMQNNNKETPIIIACKNKFEEIFNILYNYSNLDLQDIHGNTVYHYICLNQLCCHSTIPLIKNNFGYTPRDYCTIIDSYYTFV